MITMDFRFARLLSAGPITAAIAVVAALAAPATAQRVDGDNQPINAGGLLATKVTQGRNWRIGARLNTLTDSNFRRVPGAAAESALRVTPSIDAGFGLPVGRQQLFIGGLIGRDYFINRSSFNRNRWTLGGGLGWRLGSRCTGVLGIETRRRLIQVDDQAEFTNNQLTTNVYGGTANCQTATGLGFGGSIEQSNASNNVPERRVFDYRSTTYAANVSYGNQSLGQLSLGGSLSNVGYPQRPVPTPTGLTTDGIRSINARLGYSKSLGTRLQVSAGVSYLKTTPDPDTILAVDPAGQLVVMPRSPFSGTGYDVSVSYRPSSRLSVVVAADRGVSTSRNVGALFTIRQGLSADINYKIGPSIDFGVGVSRRNNTYKGSFVTSVEPQQRERDRFDRVYAHLDYTPVRLYSIAFEVAHQRRRAVPATFDFASTTAALRLNVTLGKG